MLLALQRPAYPEHTALGSKVTGHLPDFTGRNIGKRLGPFSIFRLTVGFAHQVRQKPLKTDGVLLQEVFILQVFFDQRVGKPQHDRHIGIRSAGPPLRLDESAVMVGADIIFYGADANHTHTGLLHLQQLATCRVCPQTTSIDLGVFHGRATK